MDRFYVTKKILANGNKWSDILGSRGAKTDTDGIVSLNYFEYEGVRNAWKEMETHFCAETVMAMIASLNDVFADEFTPVVETEEINRVVVCFTNKYLKDMPQECVRVEYVFCGNLMTSDLVYGKD